MLPMCPAVVENLRLISIKIFADNHRNLQRCGGHDTIGAVIFCVNDDSRRGVFNLFGSTSVGIDLGTANILVYVKGKGIVLREPSVVAVDKDNDAVLAIGEEAREMIGRTPGNIVAIRPLRDGVIADYDMTEAMIRHFLEKVVGRSFIFRPRVMIMVLFRSCTAKTN